MAQKALTDQDRHQIIMEHLKEINKTPKVFHLRWNDECLTAKVVTTVQYFLSLVVFTRNDGFHFRYHLNIQTPAFWYKRYGWKRKHVEDMFFKCQIALSQVMETAFDEVYGGGYEGQRWRDTALRGKLDDLWQRLYGGKNQENNVLSKVRKFNKGHTANAKKDDDNGNTESKSSDIANGGDGALNYEQFEKALQMGNVAVSTQLAKNIFAQIDTNKNGLITKVEMDGLLATLDAMDFEDISDLANNQELLNLCLTKKVMDCLLSDEGLEFVETDFVMDLKTNLEFNDPEALSYLNRLGDRDIDWKDRIVAMDAINAGLESGKYDAMLNDENQVQQLLFGIAVQLLDDRPVIQTKAIEIVPNLLGECFVKCDTTTIDVVYEHLPEILDNLFLVLDRPQMGGNFEKVKFGVDEMIDNVIATQHPVAALQLAKVFAAKCEIENVLKPETRNFGLQCLSKIMFSLESPYLEFDVQEESAPIVDESKLPQSPDPYREWLDVATSHQPGPSVRYMQQNAGKRRHKQYRSGEENELVLGYGKGQYRAEPEEEEKEVYGMNQQDLLAADDEKADDDNLNRKISSKSAEEIGSEFVDAVSNGLSAAMMDPNQRNKVHGFKTNNILTQLQPEFGQNLQKESRHRYEKWVKPLPVDSHGKPKALPPMKKIDPKLITMSTDTAVNVNFKPTLPDI